MGVVAIEKEAFRCDDTASGPPPHVHHFSNHSLLTAGDQLVVPRGGTHISCHYKNTIEGTGEKKEQTNKHEQYAWG